MHSKSMKAILVDDEENAIKVLSSLLAAYDDVKIVGSYTKPEAALAEIAKVKPDVIFLDIEMGYIDGLTMADLFNQQHFVDIIFVTAYAQYAVQAFELNAIDYLLKPVQKKDWIRRLNASKWRARRGSSIIARSRQRFSICPSQVLITWRYAIKTGGPWCGGRRRRANYFIIYG